MLMYQTLLELASLASFELEEILLDRLERRDICTLREKAAESVPALKLTCKNIISTMNKLGLILTLVVCLSCLALPGTCIWSGGSAMYECCCPKSHRCPQSCFMCRNSVFVCNCEQCSCYADSHGDKQPHEPHRTAPNKKGLDLIDVLLGSGSKKHGRHGNKS